MFKPIAMPYCFSLTQSFIQIGRFHKLQIVFNNARIRVALNSAFTFHSPAAQTSMVLPVRGKNTHRSTGGSAARSHSNVLEQNLRAGVQQLDLLLPAGGPPREGAVRTGSARVRPPSRPAAAAFQPRRSARSAVLLRLSRAGQRAAVGEE